MLARRSVAMQIFKSLITPRVWKNTVRISTFTWMPESTMLYGSSYCILLANELDGTKVQVPLISWGHRDPDGTSSHVSQHQRDMGHPTLIFCFNYFNCARWRISAMKA